MTQNDPKWPTFLVSEGLIKMKKVDNFEFWKISSLAQKIVIFRMFF